MTRVILAALVLGVTACANTNKPTDTGSMAYPAPVTGSGMSVPGRQVPVTTGGMAIQQPGSPMERQAPTERDTAARCLVPPGAAGPRGRIEGSLGRFHPAGAQTRVACRTMKVETHGTGSLGFQVRPSVSSL